MSITSQPEQDTIYTFAETMQTNTYYLNVFNYQNAESYTIVVEQLDL